MESVFLTVLFILCSPLSHSKPGAGFEDIFKALGVGIARKPGNLFNRHIRCLQKPFDVFEPKIFNRAADGTAGDFAESAIDQSA